MDTGGDGGTNGGPAPVEKPAPPPLSDPLLWLLAPVAVWFTWWFMFVSAENGVEAYMTLPLAVFPVATGLLLVWASVRVAVRRQKQVAYAGCAALACWFVWIIPLYTMVMVSLYWWLVRTFTE